MLGDAYTSIRTINKWGSMQMILEMHKISLITRKAVHMMDQTQH